VIAFLKFDFLFVVVANVVFVWFLAVGGSRNLGSCGNNGILCGAHGRSPEKNTRKSP
jgi:hypothetical protein